MSPDKLIRYEFLLRQARAAVASDEKKLRRIDRLQQSLRFARIEIYRHYGAAGVKSSASINRQIKASAEKNFAQDVREFVEKAKRFGAKKITPSASTPDKYLQQTLKE